MNNSWKDFKRLNTLSIGFAESLAKQATIFGNGKNQVEILVTLSMQGTDNKPLEISQEELLNAIYLCDYRTGEMLSDPWNYGSKPNEFNHAVSYQNTATIDRNLSSVEEQAGKLNVRLYVSAGSSTQNGIIAVGIRVPGVGDFDTTEDGTGVPNGPGGETGSPFKNPKYVSIHLIPAINYADVDNLQVKASDFETLKSSVPWEITTGPAGGIMKYKTGTLKKRTIHIKPTNDIPNNRFLHHEFKYTPIENKDVSNTPIIWGNQFVPTFDVIEGGGFPCAVIANDSSEERYHQVNLWYGERNDVSMHGYYFMEFGGMYLARGMMEVNDSILQDIGEAVLCVYKSTIPIDPRGTSKLYWQNVIREVDLSVIDLYGNSGNLKVSFDTSEYFDKPRFYY